MEYPECEKMKSVRDESQAIGNFIEWLSEQEYEIRDWANEHYKQPGTLNKSTEQMLADYFEIDLKKVEKEKQAIIASLSEA